MQVRRFPSAPGLKVPHMGWGDVTRVSVDHPLIRTLDCDARFYFTHSYYLDPNDRDHVLLTARHGIEFTAAVGTKNIVGVQFHPEKSHRFGKQLLETFSRWSKC
jgi:glutamine amidotransferase